jgi:tetratricopeptide (TPR) repeat protein
MSDRLLVFISYARADGAPLMEQVYDRLTKSKRYYPWADRPDGDARERLDTNIEEKLAGANVVIYILSTASARGLSWSRDELHMLRRLEENGNSKPIITLRLHPGIMAPLSVQRWVEIDFTAGTDQAWSELDARLAQVASAGGLADAIDSDIRANEEAAGRASDAERARFTTRTSDLRRAAQQERSRAEDPAEARRRVADEISRAPDLERATARPVTAAGGRIRSVNEIPSFPPVAFRDRLPQLERIEHGLGRAEIGLVAVSGPDGIGKTEMIRHLRDRLAGPTPPVAVDGFVYLSAYGYRRVTPAVLLTDLARVADPEVAAELTERLADSVPWPEKIARVLVGLGEASVIVVMDHADELVNHQGGLVDTELAEVIEGLVTRRESHQVRIVLVARRAPETLLRDLGDRVLRVPLDDGLPRDDTELHVRALAEGEPGSVWATASAAQFDRLHELTGGSPRALELASGVTRQNPGRTLDWLLDLLAAAPSGQVGRTLFMELFQRLYRPWQRVVQALAIYGRPVLPTAIDHLLEELLPGHPSRPLLDSLHRMRLVRRDGDRFYIPPTPDARLVLNGIPRGTPSDRGQSPLPLSQLALLCHAANYFEKIRPDADQIERVEQLYAHFSEIELRLRGEQYAAAFQLMTDLDDEFLIRWGHSDALVPWRRRLRGKLDHNRHEAVNRSYLVAALGQQEDWFEVRRELHEALRHAGRLRLSAPADRIGLHLQLAGVDLDDDRLASARRRYRATIAGCVFLRVLTRADVHEYHAEALARFGLALSLTGRFDAGLARYRQAERIARGVREPDRSMVEWLRLLNQGWTLGQLGEREAALRAIRGARELTRSVGIVLEEGRCLNAESAVLLDWNQGEPAVHRAVQAVEIAGRTRNRELSREANVTLALAYLALSEFDQAAEAADEAAYYHQSLHAAGALGLQGVTAFRLGQISKARIAFQEACVRAEERTRREPRLYQLLDLYGVVLSGYALCTPGEPLDRAIETFRRARAVTAEPGVVRRATLLLDHLGAEVQAPRFLEVRTAATRGPSRSAGG